MAGNWKPVYELMLAQEAGNWATAKLSRRNCASAKAKLGEMWWQAMQWARQVNCGK